MASPIPAGDSPAVSGFNAPDASVAEVYRAYGAFFHLAVSLGRSDLAHQLVLCEPLSIAGEAPLIAAGIASAASLCIEPNPASVRQSIRSGAIDFTVNNLDEALRALKNEIRKGLSIAICLEGDPQPVIAEMIERGVQPDVLCRSSLSADPLPAVFLERGSRSLSLKEEHLPESLIDTFWQVRQLPGKWLPMVDELVASSLPPEDTLRRNWLKRAPRYLGRALRTSRYLPMSESERGRCEELLHAALAEEKWVGVEVHFRSK